MASWKEIFLSVNVFSDVLKYMTIQNLYTLMCVSTSLRDLGNKSSVHRLCTYLSFDVDKGDESLLLTLLNRFSHIKILKVFSTSETLFSWSSIGTSYFEFLEDLEVRNVNFGSLRLDDRNVPVVRRFRFFQCKFQSFIIQLPSLQYLLLDFCEIRNTSQLFWSINKCVNLETIDLDLEIEETLIRSISINLPFLNSLRIILFLTDDEDSIYYSNAGFKIIIKDSPLLQTLTLGFDALDNVSVDPREGSSIDLYLLRSMENHPFIHALEQHPRISSSIHYFEIDED
jgi:hypothetical protein